MYLILFIALVCFVIAWQFLRHFARIWTQRSLSIQESMVAGIFSWTFFLALAGWCIVNVLFLIDYFASYETKNLWILIFSFLVLGYCIDFFRRSRYELHLDDTLDFIKDAIQFRRSGQHRLDILAYMKKHRIQHGKAVEYETEERSRLQADLQKEKDLLADIALLRKGTSVDLSELWSAHVRTDVASSMYTHVEHAQIDPVKKQFCVSVMFPDLDERQFLDETAMVRLNRQVYDFLQAINAEPWLKTYSAFFDTLFLICKALKKKGEGTTFSYPFMKVSITTSELHKLEGGYFNPRKLSQIAALAFNNGNQV